MERIMTTRIESPYLGDDFVWLRGNLHTHTSLSDGENNPQDVIDEYFTRGYDFLMLSDHDHFTDPELYDSRGMLLIPGNEISKDGPHLLHVDAREALIPQSDRQQVINAIRQTEGFAVLCHPNWQGDHNHYPTALLQTLNGYIGIEIYNAVLRRSTGNPIATDRWDILLSAGRRLWGFAHDDSHKDGDRELAWLMVQIKESSLIEVVNALRLGRFYGSTGVEITDIRVAGRTITISTKNASTIFAVVDTAKRVATSHDKKLAVRIPDDASWSYIRFECWGTGESMAWTQPFFLSNLDKPNHRL